MFKPILLGLNCKIYFVNLNIKIILILLYETNMTYLCVCEFQKSKYEIGETLTTRVIVDGVWFLYNIIIIPALRL